MWWGWTGEASLHVTHGDLNHHQHPGAWGACWGTAGGKRQKDFGGVLGWMEAALKVLGGIPSLRKY